jgi:hypothetical protein
MPRFTPALALRSKRCVAGMWINVPNPWCFVCPVRLSLTGMNLIMLNKISETMKFKTPAIDCSIGKIDVTWVEWEILVNEDKIYKAKAVLKVSRTVAFNVNDIRAHKIHTTTKACTVCNPIGTLANAKFKACTKGTAYKLYKCTCYDKF